MLNKRAWAGRNLWEGVLMLQDSYEQWNTSADREIHSE